MKLSIGICKLGVCLLAMMTMMSSATAQDDSGQNQGRKHHHYKVIDLGTLGGANSESTQLNYYGTVAGDAESGIPDLFAPNCWNNECAVEYAFKWRDGRRTVLGSLAKNANSIPFSENDWGWEAGMSETGLLDDSLGTPQYAPVLWKNGKIINLGTLGGASGLATSVNNRGEVVGGVSNGVPDTLSYLDVDNWGFGPFPANTQTRAFVWANGLLFDLGTLGGADSIALFNDDKGQVVGLSYVDDVPVFGTFPGTATFLWERGEMKNIGGLGGHFTGARWLNNRGEIVGVSNLINDPPFPHAFLWDGRSVRDLGTLGGDWSTADFVTDNGLITGYSETVAGTHDLGHPYLWRDNHMIDLGPPAVGFNCAAGTSANIHAQVVGGAGCNANGLGYPFIWEKSNPIIDLNTLVVPGTKLLVQDAFSINDKGEIACNGILPTGEQHACLMVPVDFEHEWDDDATAGVQTAALNSVSASNRVPEGSFIKSLLTESKRTARAPAKLRAPLR
jgi:probable HAF family extracellular repeat protein